MRKRQYIFYILISFIFIGTVTFSIMSYYNTKHFVLESVERETDELLNNFTAEVNRFTMERTADIELMADLLPYMIERGEDVTAFLLSQTERASHFKGLGFITPDGEVNTSDGQRFPVQQGESFERALQGEVSFSEVYTLNQDPTQNVTAISVPVIDHDGTIIGVVSGIVNLSDLVSDLVEESNLPGTVFLLKDDDVLFASNEDISFEQAIPNSDQFLRAIDDQSVGSWDDSQDKLRFIKYESTWNNWVVVIDSSTNKATKQVPQSFWLSTVLIISATIITLLVSLYFNRLLRRERQQGEKDLLTGLGNRTRLETNVAKRIALYPHAKATFYFIKLDRFTDFTERVGYYLSDELLFAVGKRLDSIQDKFNVYRMGDEEFVISTQLNSIEGQHEFAQELVDKMAQPISLGKDNRVELTASVGVRSAVGTEDMNVVMQDVIFASREAGKRGGNQYVYVTEELSIESQHQRQLATELAYALENEEFYLLYQPIYSCFHDHIVSFEALMRWKSPTLGTISPVKFIPLLEESDKIIDVGRWLIYQVSEQVLIWESEGYDNFTVALNVSTKQLQDDSFLSDVKQMLSETGVNPNRLVFEVTESVVVQDIDQTYNILESLNELGIKTAIDDFGTGYSSLSILKNLPFQYMKLDRVFVMEVLSDDGVSEAILRSLIKIANSLDLVTITEGVETLDQLKVLRTLGTHRIQGYYFSKPLLPGEAITFLNAKGIVRGVNK